jgi:hypothetical protein
MRGAVAGAPVFRGRCGKAIERVKHVLGVLGDQLVNVDDGSPPSPSHVVSNLEGPGAYGVALFLIHTGERRDIGDTGPLNPSRECLGDADGGADEREGP